MIGELVTEFFAGVIAGREQFFDHFIAAEEIKRATTVAKTVLERGQMKNLRFRGKRNGLELPNDCCNNFRMRTYIFVIA